MPGMGGAVYALAYVTDLAEAVGGITVPGKDPFPQLSITPPKLKRAVAGVQPQWIQGIRSGDGVGEDQETTA